MTSILKNAEGVEDVAVDFDNKKATIKGKSLNADALSKKLEKDSNGQYKSTEAVFNDEIK